MTGFNRIIISRTDSIGDVILTLPLAGLLKEKLPGCELVFLGRSYTREVIRACEHIDMFLNWDNLSEKGDNEGVVRLKEVKADLILHVFPRPEIAKMAKKASIPIRLGTTNRLYHWFTCNKLVRLSRRRSELHEAQLNIKLIKRITGVENLPLDEIHKYYGLNRLTALNDELTGLISKGKKNVILHPKSKGSAREWGIHNFIGLINILPSEQFHVFISGTDEEGEMLRDTKIFEADHVTNLTGKMNLAEFISFIGLCDSLVAASTGPLHLAAAVGIQAIGIYPPIRPMHPGRWAPLGKKATFLVKDKACSDCRNTNECHCMKEIIPEEVKKLLNS